MGVINKVKQLSRWASAGVVAAALTLALLAPARASAADDVQTIHVSGTFQTSIGEPCADGNPECTRDNLAGDLAGKNDLTLISAVFTNPMITYHDDTRIFSQYGEFHGDEHGEINQPDGSFHSTAVLTSVDGCGSTLVLHNEGVIDLVELTDQGTYDGVLTLKSC